MNKDVFIKNRENLFKLMKNNTALILFCKQKGEENTKYMVDRNFYYATGLLEYNDILVLDKINDNCNETLFISPYDEVAEKWVGRSFSKEEAMEFSGVKNCLYLKEFNDYIDNIIPKVDLLYLDLKREKIEEYMTFEEMFAEDIDVKIESANIFFQTLRHVKNPCEIFNLKKAIHITELGIESILDHLKPGMYEYQIESYFDQAIKYNGANGFSFNTIAASGVNGTCLHYSNNCKKMEDNELVLLDLGAMYQLYNADITRTFPVNGKFTPRQKEIYNIVLEGQRKIFKAIKPGVTTRDLNNVLVKFYEEELMRIGLITDPKDVFKYYYHGVSHHLGLETHDSCTYTKLEVGAVITVEPGLYIKEEGIGIRIEDDALVTENGSICLSQEILKTVEDIEDYMLRRK